jgi:uncharacterized protein (DUF4415 family)
MQRKKPAGKKPQTDPDDAPELTAEWFAGADLMRGERIVRRGRPPLKRPKEAVTLRIDADVLDHFRGRGPGWQTRINAALRKAAGKPAQPAQPAAAVRRASARR